MGRGRRYALSDSAQQVVGGFLLAGPFVVTEEVWVLARQMSGLQALLTVVIVFSVGYGTLYKADDERDPDREDDVAGVPVRFISLILVSYLSVFLLAVSFNAPGTFLSDLANDGGHVALGIELEWDVISVTLKAISIGSVFSVIGAATADTLF
ncbi:DUF2391 family protein [Halopelagius longus]|uniref:DUF2391 family protein n=1 Tax=Halopelagius longus TaxID=1236180 RepID=A0A1H1ENB4_9EURY|nr:DUF2391 family protein [Halopelagius longus]RDI71827.1 DUF2391 family protein [Halopelagius longus]SDQ90235.1 Putative integral membrane protein [Halopelagius longus]